MKEKRWEIICGILMVLIVVTIDTGINPDRFKIDKMREERIEHSQETKEMEEEEQKVLFEDEEYSREPPHYVFWYKYKGDEFDYAEEETFRKLKIIYDGIDFTGEFKKGNTEVYDYYKVKYAKLLNGEKKITDRDGKEYNLEYYGYSIESLLSADIYYFDMDEDGLPELCLSKNSTLIIKYMSDPD